MSDTYDKLFKRATSHEPFPYQREYALGADCPSLLSVPTGLGKTATVVLGWLWRRRFADDETRRSTPRRLIYCLPMRVLVEQTVDCVQQWLGNLGLLEREEDAADGRAVAVRQLMGGELDDDWQRYPERDAVLVGTQDMLLSRALNRGYAMSRFAWPMAFGLLHSDAWWVFDEVQLMGTGLATTAQLEGFRRSLGTALPSRSLWMSATMDRRWLATVDFESSVPELSLLRLGEADRACRRVAAREQARKPLSTCPVSLTKKSRKSYAKELAGWVGQQHQPGSLSLVIVNTVDRARDVLASLEKRKSLDAELVLLHSRFRSGDRAERLEQLKRPVGPEGRIVVSTQVVEAGVDLDARLLVTELAPWASLVQRFGRCNRRGDLDDAVVAVCDIDVSSDPKLAAPYAEAELLVAREHLAQHTDVGPARLVELELPFEHGLVLRRRDLSDLFDTTPDLSGADIDVSPYVRETDDHDVRVFWRDVPEGPSDDEPAPARDELCPVPIGELRAWLDNHGGWCWDLAAESWARCRESAVIPGQTVLLQAADGGYEPRLGWTGARTAAVLPVSPPAKPLEGFSNDFLSVRVEATIAEHTDRVVETLEDILTPIDLPAVLQQALRDAARFHDAGKAHPVFQRTMHGGQSPPEAGPWLAKSRQGGARHDRKGFRHELATGLALLRAGRPDWVVYLAASHHGRVRLAIRSRPDEVIPRDAEGLEQPSRRAALGIWDGEPLPAVDLGGGQQLPETVLDLGVMELGEGALGRSWLARMTALRDDPLLGPFRIAFGEAVLRAADQRGSEVSP